MKLDVYVSNRLVAQLYKQRDEYILQYLPNVSNTDFISLTMPVREAPWKWPRDLHPFFRQNLPEGYLLNVIRETFGPLLDGTDLSLLAIVGQSGIGRVKITPAGMKPAVPFDTLAIEELLKIEYTAEQFVELVKCYARTAVSGVMPKLTAPTKQVDLNEQSIGKPTLKMGRHIIKGSDKSLPYLGFNEFFSMRVLKRLNVAPVANSQMSADGKILIVERFDVDEIGEPIYGLEDACSLLGLPPHERYATTMEKIINALRVYLPPEAMRQQLEYLGWHILTNYIVRNADCHSKNIALYYRSPFDVSFTPIYDVVSTAAYPTFSSNPPGLSIEGRQTWAPGQSLERFFLTRLDIRPQRYKQMVEALCESAVVVGQEIIVTAKNESRWKNIAKQIVYAWNDGMAALRDPKKAEQFQSLKPAIKAAKLSDPNTPKIEKIKIGRSPLLAPPSKTRRSKK